MKLYLTRHGETDFNLQRRYQGQLDIPLNQTGIMQARQFAKRLSNMHFDAIVSSDLSRASDTAKIVLAEDKRVTAEAVATDMRWRELSFGKWEGMNHDELMAQWGDEARVWFADIIHSAPPGGESLLQLSERVGDALEELKASHVGQTVLLVTHSGVIQALLCLSLGVDLNRYWQFKPLQTSLTVLNFFDKGAALELFNDCSHLKDETE